MSFWNSFWDIIWFFFWAFAFIAYLSALFAVIADLFRDRSLNGWWKALWIVFLVFVPFLTVLVYLVARGGNIAQRDAHQAQQTHDGTEQYIRGVTGISPAAEITKAKSLMDAGTITAQEYEGLKSKALG